MRFETPPIRAHLLETVRTWIGTCVQKSRAESLVNYRSLDKVWSQISEHRGKRFTLVPEYVPFTFEKNRKTCFGIESVSFRVAEFKPAEVSEGIIEITRGPTEEQRRAAARRAIPLVRNSSASGFVKSRMLCVLRAIEQRGNHFDTRYFDVEKKAYQTTGAEIPIACFTQIQGAERVCRSVADATVRCGFDFADALVDAGDKPDAAFLAKLLSIDSTITNGVSYLNQLQSFGKNVMGCEFLHRVVIPAVASAATGDSVYACQRW